MAARKLRVQAGISLYGREGRQRTFAGDLADRNVPTAQLHERIGEVRPRIQGAGWNLAVVVYGRRVVLGLLGEEELAQDAGRVVEDAMLPGPRTYRPHSAIQKVHDYLQRHKVAYVLVTKPDGTLVGVIKRDDIAQAIEDAGDKEEGSSLSCS